jgi:hypothetical protein
MSIAAASELELAPTPARPLLAPLALACACVALADWLFYGWAVGISLSLFLGLLGVAGNRVQATRRTRIVMTAIWVAGLAPLVEDVNQLSVLVSTLATALFVNVMTAPAIPSWQRLLFEAATVPLRGPFRLAVDLFGLPQIPALRPIVGELRSDRDICRSRRQLSENWRAWGFRTWRLQRYLAKNPDIPLNYVDSGKG